MAHILRSANILARQIAADSSNTGTIQVSITGTPGHCDSGNNYNGDLGVRISAIFVILVGSLFGAWFPIFAKRRVKGRLFEWVFFAAKYFGSGVIIATAFIHLLAPANEALQNPCLTGPITDYDWVEGICLMTIFVLFFLELMTMRYGTFGHSHDHDEENTTHSHNGRPSISRADSSQDIKMAQPNHPQNSHVDTELAKVSGSHETAKPEHEHHHTPNRGEDHLGHMRDHAANSDLDDNDLGSQGEKHHLVESYAAQMTAIFILEFGVIFHSVFIGLTLAVAGAEFTTLYVVLVFHQTFEGLGLGTRLSTAPWPKSKRLTPYVLGAAYAVSTPIATAIGLGIRNTYPPGSQTTLIVNGVFDSVSAGILIYTGLVELMAHEFMFSPTMQRASMGTVLSAFGMMCGGAGLMALLGKWA